MDSGIHSRDTETQSIFQKYTYISQTHKKISKYTRLQTFKWPDEHYRNLGKLFRTANAISWNLTTKTALTSLSQSSQKL